MKPDTVEQIFFFQYFVSAASSLDMLIWNFLNC